MSEIRLRYFVQPLCWLLLISGSTHAGVMFSGRFTLDNTSSIFGAPKGDSFDFEFTLNGAAKDMEHGFSNNSGGGLNFYGRYSGAVTAFKMTAVSGNVGDFDPSGLTYDLLGSTILTTDVNPPSSDDPLDLMNEHMTISIGVLTPGKPLHRINFNLYNSTFHSPLATRQLWLDTSTSSNGFTLSQLFLHGMHTLSEFKSIKQPPTGRGLVDSVYLDGGTDNGEFSGTWGSGTVKSLIPVPEPSSCLIFFGILCTSLLGHRRQA